MAPSHDVLRMLASPRGPTVKAIQNLLQDIGAATSGTKDVLQTRLIRETSRTIMPDPLNERESSRILSIDMGIRNLAYCVADVHMSTPKAGAANMEIRAWRRLDLTEEIFKSTFKRRKDLVEEAEIDGREEEDPYTPASLSSTAYWLLKRELLQLKPDIILIERQRWRSSGSSAIQQWTVRVNSLESMLWAVLTTLRAEHGFGSSKSTGYKNWWWVYGVDPKRVGSFWLEDDMSTVTSKQRKKAKERDPVIESETEVEDPVEAPKKLSRGKVEKKAKIQLLRGWLNSGSLSTTFAENEISNGESSIHRPFISFKPLRIPYADAFTGDAETTRQSLLYATDTPAERSRRTQIRKADVKKVDDLTDCFLQAAAWVAWEENRIQLREHWVMLRKDLEEKLGRKLPGLIGPNSVEGAVKELQKRTQTNKKEETVKKKTSKPSAKGRRKETG